MRINGRLKLLALCAGALCMVSSVRAVTNIVTDDIGADTTWLGTNTYLLKTVVFVTNGATLTIQPGTIIRGERDTLFGTNNAPGTLVISRGSKIRAMGTKTQPIVMTTTNDNHFVGPTPVAGTSPWNQVNNQIGREWGGLILLGNTYVARTTNSPSPSITVQIEGLQPFGSKSEYGGGNDDDDSGELHYVSIRYGGFVLGAANEINGLTLGAVGRNTEVDHVEVFQNKDDGFEFFGGTVNSKYLVSWNNADDSFDWDEGFRGKGQFWFAVQGPLTKAGGSPDFSDKGFEMDGATVTDSAKPSSAPTIYNATIVGTGKTTKKQNTSLHFRDGSGGRFYNSIFLDAGGACALIEGDTGGSYDSADLTLSNYVNDAFYTHSGGGKMLEIKHSVFWNMGTNDVFFCAANASLLANVWGAEGTDGNKAHLAYPLFTDTTLSNKYRAETSGYPVNDATNLPILDLYRSANTFVGSGIAYTDSVLNVYFPVEGIDPGLPTNSALLSAGMTPPPDGFYTPIKMVGGFGTRNWAGGWTLASRQGVLSSIYTNADYSVFDENPAVTNNFLSFTVQFPTANGQNYEVQWAPAAIGPWTTLATVFGNGSTVTYTDQRPTITERYYRLATAIAP